MRDAGTWVRIAPCHDLPLREGRAVKVGDREIAIFNLGDRFLAVDNRCPHKGGPLADGILSGAAVVCPLHGWKISLETGEGLNSAGASSCVETFRTRVEHGVILIELTEASRKGQEGRTQELPAICAEPAGIAVASESRPATRCWPCTAAIGRNTST
jgi:nitrite reductase (NADH) small subunit